MKKLKAYKWGLLGGVLGGIGGCLYWSQIGCITGTCPLKSHWQTMIPYGTVMGYLGVDLVKSMVEKYANKS